MEKRIPKRRFKEFENAGEWQEKKLGEVADIRTGSSDLKDADENGKYPFFVRSQNIERSNRYIFNGEAILIPGEGKLGDIYHYIDGKFDYHQRVYKISDFEYLTANGKFVLYYLQKNFKIHALKYTVKATVDSLRLPMLTDFQIFIPNLKEQEKIGDFFQKLDRIMELNRDKLEKLKSSKSAYLADMFPREGEAYPRRRFEGFREAWEEKKLGEVVKIQSGVSPSKFDEGSELYIKVDDLNYSTREQFESNIMVALNSKVSMINENSIIFPKRGAAIMTNKVRILNRKAYMDTNMMALEPLNIDTNFLYMYIYKIGLYKIADTSTIPQINNKHIDPYKILIPSLKEQEKIGNFFKKLDDLIRLQEKKIEKLENLKKAYLNEMFV